jgi:hypothetical protein
MIQTSTTFSGVSSQDNLASFMLIEVAELSHLSFPRISVPLLQCSPLPFSSRSLSQVTTDFVVPPQERPTDEAVVSLSLSASARERGPRFREVARMDDASGASKKREQELRKIVLSWLSKKGYRCSLPVSIPVISPPPSPDSARPRRVTEEIPVPAMRSAAAEQFSKDANIVPDEGGSEALEEFAFRSEDPSSPLHAADGGTGERGGGRGGRGGRAMRECTLLKD